MTEQIPQEVLHAFIPGNPDRPPQAAGNMAVEEIGTGLINHSWKVRCEPNPDFFLQQINANVFQRPADVQENYLHIWQYAALQHNGLRMPAPLYCHDGSILFTDTNGNYWRAFEWIPESKTLSVAENPSQAGATARTFAKFTASLGGMNVGLLKEVIPGFHDLSLRYKQFESSLKTALPERTGKAIPLVSELKKRERYTHFFEMITGSDEFLKRVMHHDAKISNILFHEKTGNVICPVDYDTVMPGYFFSDLGDMIRSMACNSEEDSNKEGIAVRKDFYEHIITGYTGELGGQLSFSERKYIHSAGLLMTYMQALRFTADYLNGDTYYQVNYPDHNLNRAINQLALLQKLEEFLQDTFQFKL